MTAVQRPAQILRVRGVQPPHSIRVAWLLDESVLSKSEGRWFDSLGVTVASNRFNPNRNVYWWYLLWCNAAGA